MSRFIANADSQGIELEIKEKYWEANIVNNERSTNTFSKRWTAVVTAIQKPFLRAVLGLALAAARNPRRVVVSMAIFALATVVTGFLTNFTTQVDGERLWTPVDSRLLKHSDWIDEIAGFPPDPKKFRLLLHANGKNVLGKDSVSQVFTALDVIRDLPAYQYSCGRQQQVMCNITGVTGFWNHSVSIFETEVASVNYNNDSIIQQMSATRFPTGVPVVEKVIFGLPQRTDQGILTTTQAYHVEIALPDTVEVLDLARDVVDAMLAYRSQLDPEALRVEVWTYTSFDDEFKRAIWEDIHLIPIVFAMMSCFTAIVFWRRGKVRSQALLGFSAVCCVLLSIMTGFGLLFIGGVPFTSLTQLVPFLIFGIGLDDAFILSGSFNRTDPSKDPVERIRETIEDAGVSITLTTLSTSLALAIGASSKIPAVFLLCYYAFPTIIVDFLFQITFFVACLVLDARRQNQQRIDCFTCIKVKTAEPLPKLNGSERHMVSGVDKGMECFARQLLKRSIYIPLLIAFTTMTGVLSYRASKLSVAFEVTEVFPEDSYVADMLQALDLYMGGTTLYPYAYFRYVDQSNASVQEQMEQYVAELISVDAILQPPSHFWLPDFQTFVNATSELSDLDFRSQLDLFLSNDLFRELYNQDIVRDDSGAIIESRVRIAIDMDVDDVDTQSDALRSQRLISSSQPINKGRGDQWAFFLYIVNFNVIEMYEEVEHQSFLSAVTGVTAISGLTLLLVPHWSAVMLVMPLMCILYIDLTGFLEVTGQHLNPVTFITLIISIGLMVDFLQHILLRYYESPGTRHEKVVHTLRTMGSSVLLGGFTTFLGTLCLAFSTSAILQTLFLSYIGLVTIGCSHGLILLPILLGLIGPEDPVDDDATGQFNDSQDCSALEDDSGSFSE